MWGGHSCPPILTLILNLAVSVGPQWGKYLSTRLICLSGAVPTVLFFAL